MKKSEAVKYAIEEFRRKNPARSLTSHDDLTEFGMLVLWYYAKPYTKELKPLDNNKKRDLLKEMNKIANEIMNE